VTPRVLIAYDGSDGAHAAVVTAADLFVGASGRLLTVVELPLGVADVQAIGFGVDAETARRGLEAMTREIMDSGGDIAARGVAAAGAAGMSLEPHVVERDEAVWQTILAGADAIDADVIVCGSRGRGGLARSLLGSTSTSVLHHARRPVLVVPTEPAALDGPALVAYDASPEARAAIATTGRLLPSRRAVIIHVWHSAIRHTLSGRVLAGGPIDDLRDFSADYERHFADSAGSIVQQGVTLAGEAGLEASGEAIESGSGAWRAVAEAASDREAAVIVSGSRGRGTVAATVLGSVSSGLVHNAHAPTLIVRAAT
jgi:nucleotide-binding universal stress UspA family protein